MDKIKVVEWNINHRLGYSGRSMPNWITEEIKSKHADVIIFTECSRRVSNWEKLCKETFKTDKYLLFSSNNDQVNNNDITIIINKEKLDVVSVNSLISEGHAAPDHLQLRCKKKSSNKMFSIVGMRIHASNISDAEKRKQFMKVLYHLSEEEIAIIAGDFNCNRRSYTDNNSWNLKAIDDIIKNSFDRVTPEGASWARDVSSDDNYCFALDHFLIKGISDFCIYPYDRSFVKYDSTIYKWGTNFQAEYGWEKSENKVPDPYPDHAILSADFSF